MKLSLRWAQSVRLGKRPYGVDLEKIPKVAGIYIFLRVYGDAAEARYVGKASNLRGRIKQQLNNLKLMDGIAGGPNGIRRIVYAEFVAKQGKTSPKALPLCEKTLIRYYLAQGHNLLNIQGAKLKFHELNSTRVDLKKFLPASSKMLVK